MANLSNINNKFIVTDGGQALINQTAAGFNADADDLIVGNLSGNTGITIASGSNVGNYGSIYFADAAGSGTASKAGYIRYEQNTSEMTIGINAVEKIAIDISGNTTFSGNVNIVTASTGQTPYAQTDQLVIENTGNSGIQFLAGTTSFTGMFFGDSGSATRGQLYYDNNADSFTMITSATTGSGIFINSSGNIGIGTDSPTQAKLCIDGTQNSIYLTRGGASDTKWTISSDSVSMYIGEAVGGNIMTLREDGHVGIGTTGPSSPLHVTAAPANGTYLSYLYNSGTHNSSHGLNVQTAATNIAAYGLRVNTGGDSNALAVMGNGNVGIGTGSPSAKLEVTTSTAGWSSIIQNTNGASDANGLLIKAGTISSEYSLKVSNSTDSTNFMVVKGNGNVGIGTTSPNQEGFGTTNRALSVKAPTSGGVANLELIGLGNADNDELGYVNFMSQAATDSAAAIVGLRYTSDTSGKLSFRTSGSERMRIDSSGNVGIGYTNPIYKLQLISTKTVATNIGMYSSAQGASTSNYSFYADANGATNNWAFYAASGNSYFANGIRLGGNGSSNELDDYEEGTWTPTIVDLSSNAATLSTASGTYTKIGRQVILNYKVTLSNKGSMTGNYVLMGGLPFNHPNNDYNGTGMVDYFYNFDTAYSSLAWDTSSTTTVFWLTGVGAGGSGSTYYVPTSAFGGNETIKGSVIYITS